MSVKQCGLKLAEFKLLYRFYRRYIGWFDHLLLGALMWIESKVIQERTVNTVSQAVRRWKKITDTTKDQLPIPTETPSKTSQSLPDMRLTAPWYDPTNDGVKGG